MRVFSLVPFTFLVGAAPQAAASGGGIPQDGFADHARPFLDQHCVRCHRDHSAESRLLDLSQNLTSLDLEGGAIDWEWLLERVEFGDMPPPGEAAPEAEERDAFVQWLGESLRANGPDELGPAASSMRATGLRRLTALEYGNAIRDLFGVAFDAGRWLPEDAVGHGFDHVATAQSLSEAHFVRYLEAAEAIADRLVPLVLLDSGVLRERFEAGSLEGGGLHSGDRILATRGAVKVDVVPPCAGRYRVRAEVYGMQAGPDPCQVRLRAGEAKPALEFEVSAERAAPAVIEGEFELEGAASASLEVFFVNDYFRPAENGAKSEDRNLVVRWIELEGPLEGSLSGSGATPFMERWRLADGAGADDAGDSDQRPSLEARVAECAALVWRRHSVPREDVDRLLSLSSADESESHRMRAALIGMLVSPRFLFLVDEPAPGATANARGAIQIDRASLATRLAAFLWRSVPDAALLERALISESARALAEEMLEDERSLAFADTFGEQWLQLRGAEKKRASAKALPLYSDRLRRSMLEETRRVFHASLREERDLWEFIDGIETIVDGRLAAHYGLSAEAFVVNGEGAARLPREGEWRRASLEGTARRGLLGHASVLFATSEAARTSPVKRGKWVLEVLLGSAPPPPPPGVGTLAPEAEGDAALSFRQRFEAHRADPNCAACHARMDPIGFGLDAFDAIGRERAPEDPVMGDLVGQLPDGREFNGPVELAGILREEDRFLEALAERVLVFALGRGLERQDRPAVQRMLSELDPAHPTLKAMILAAVELDEFRCMAAPGEETQGDR
ncbi:hypothetical protein Poly30_33220 [Planctomycetes bacterium Poly30]|uniref:Planctomycete cytochrome C n=1 Tax=Saltatorellus ferox TaxID=2528018 RepID=A0A518EUM7_9BACT|nr:hypothetical protein Poly30_33220 [Planctomycetes bacterium Poly30]